MAVAAVDDHVPRLQHGEQLLDIIVNRLPRLDHEHDLARLIERVFEFFERVAADDVLSLRAPAGKRVHLLRRAVVHRNGEPFRFHIHDQILAHHGESDQPDLRLFHRFTLAFP